MKLYQLHIAPGEDEGEGSDWDEWFPSLKDAKKRRAALIRENPTMGGCRYDRDYQIDAVTFVNLPVKQLVLQVLNHKGYVGERVEVVPEYRARERTPEEEAKEGAWGEG